MWEIYSGRNFWRGNIDLNLKDVNRFYVFIKKNFLLDNNIFIYTDFILSCVSNR